MMAFAEYDLAAGTFAPFHLLKLHPPHHTHHTQGHTTGDRVSASAERRASMCLRKLPQESRLDEAVHQPPRPPPPNPTRFLNPPTHPPHPTHTRDTQANQTHASSVGARAAPAFPVLAGQGHVRKRGGTRTILFLLC